MSDTQPLPPEPQQAQPQEETPESLTPEQEGQDSPSGQEEAAADVGAKPEGETEDGVEESPETEATAQGEESEAKHKRTGGYRRKIDRLERQNQQLLEMLQRNGVQPLAAPQKKTPEEEAQEYVRNVARQEWAEMDAKRQTMAQQAEFERRASAVRTAEPDFGDMYEDVVGHLGASTNPHSARAISGAILTSDKGPEIIVELAKNPAELARISALPPLDAAREMGRLEAKLASGAAPQRQKQTVRPPAPPSKVGGSAASTRSLESLSISDYKRAYRSGRR